VPFLKAILSFFYAEIVVVWKLNYPFVTKLSGYAETLPCSAQPSLHSEEFLESCW
jgi:hypothetical protein